MAVNQVDDEDFPTDFVYVADYVETTPIAVNRVVTSLQVFAVLESMLFNWIACSKISR